MAEPITQLRGPYRFLSNFYEHGFQWHGIQWPTAEHAYQAAKHEGSPRFEVVRAATTPRNAKMLGRIGKPTTPNWDDRKVDIMCSILAAKFSEEPLKQMLINTAPAEIYEGNNWGDRFWGCSLESLEGENYLGKVLMDLRYSLIVYRRHDWYKMPIGETP